MKTKILTSREILKKKLSKIGSRIEENTKTAKDVAKGNSSHQNWIVANRIINNEPFSYESSGSVLLNGKYDKTPDKFPRPYLKDILADRTQKKTYKKSRQSEFTESEINDNYFLCATRPNTVIQHIFPTAKVAQRISKQKIDKAMRESPNIRDMVQKPYSSTSKQFTNNSFYEVLGSWNDFGGRGPSCDKITYDEYDFQNPKIKEIFGESMSHSKLQLEVTLSTPTVPNGLISVEFDKSCQYYWHVKCPECGEYQVMSFPDNLINFFDKDSVKFNSPEFYEKADLVYIGCKKCKAYFDRTSLEYIKNSFWKANFEHLRDIHAGWHISYFMYPWKTGKEIITKYFGFRYIEQFYNEICGLDFLSEDERLTDEMFEKCINYELKNVQNNVNLLDVYSIGIDWGKTESWVTIGGSNNDGKFQIIYLERIDNAILEREGLKRSELSHAVRAERLMNLFDANIMVNDANGLGADRDAMLAEKFRGRSFGAFYDTMANRKQLIDDKHRVSKIIESKFSETDQKVTINRTAIFKEFLSLFKEGEITLPAREPIVSQFIDHIKACNIITRQDQDSGREYQVMVSTNADHFAHSAVYCYVGWKRVFGKSSVISTSNEYEDIDDDDTYI